VRHTVPAVGYIVEAGGPVFAFTGDTAASDEIWSRLNALPRLDHLMIEVAFPNSDAALGELSRHFTPALLGSELAKLRHRPVLHLTHHKPGTEAVIAAECAVALAGWHYRHLRTGDEIIV
jgi:ribonuclease BN (tRNA processing enzyme)